MGFRVLDASAFYAGVPFISPDPYHTTLLVYDEIEHIKKEHDALGVLIETGRLEIRDPCTDSTEKAIHAAKETGDFYQLSRQDISVLALALELGGQIITDDYAVANTAENLGIKTSPVMTTGIRDAGRWIYYCPGCKTRQDTRTKCDACGTPLKKKLVKE